MRSRRNASLAIFGIGLIGLSVASGFAIAPPTQFEIDLATSRLRGAVESRRWSDLQARLDQQTCPYNRPLQQSLQEILTQIPGSQLRIATLRAALMRHVEYLCVQGWAELTYLDPASRAVVARDNFHFYLVKRAGRLWLDCGSG